MRWGAWAAGASDAATMVLRNGAGDAVRIPLTNGATYAARVVPGVYDLYVAGAGGELSVANQNARLQTGVVVAPGGPTLLNVDVPTALLEGSIRLNGDRPGGDDDAHLLLRNAAGDQAPIPWTPDGKYSVRPPLISSRSSDSWPKNVASAVASDAVPIGRTRNAPLGSTR